MAATGAERARLHRDRKRRGVVAVVPVGLEELAVMALVEDGYLDHDKSVFPLKASDKEALTAAVHELLDDWSMEVADRVLGVDGSA